MTIWEASHIQMQIHSHSKRGFTFEALASNLLSGSLAKWKEKRVVIRHTHATSVKIPGTYRCSGCHDNHEIHCWWPVNVLPICCPDWGSHRQTFRETSKEERKIICNQNLLLQQRLAFPLMQPEASFLPLGDQAMKSTQCLCPEQLC